MMSMLIEYNVTFTAKFLQQTITIGGRAKTVGITSTKFKNRLHSVLAVDYTLNDELTIPVSRVTGYDQLVTHSPYRQPSPFIKEKDMVVVGNLKVRYRPPNLANSSRGVPVYKELRETKEGLLSKFNEVITEHGGTCHGFVTVYAFMPIANSDRTRFAEQSNANSWDFLPRFFEGEDVPSSVFSSIASHAFYTTPAPYLRCNPITRMPGNFRVLYGSGVGDHENRSNQTTRLVLGTLIQGDETYHNLADPVQNAGRVVDGLISTRLIQEVTDQVERNSDCSLTPEYYSNAYDEEDEEDWDDDD